VLLGVSGSFKLALNIKDGSLCCLPDLRAPTTWKSTAQDDPRRFGKDPYMFTEVLAYQLQHCRIAGSRAAGKNHTPPLMSFSAVAVIHLLRSAKRTKSQ